MRFTNERWKSQIFNIDGSYYTFFWAYTLLKCCLKTNFKFKPLSPPVSGKKYNFKQIG